jgi:hypothetical protein
MAGTRPAIAVRIRAATHGAWRAMPSGAMDRPAEPHAPRDYMPPADYMPNARRYTSSSVSCSSTSAGSCLRRRMSWRSTFTSNPADFASA